MLHTLRRLQVAPHRRSDLPASEPRDRCHLRLTLRAPTYAIVILWACAAGCANSTGVPHLLPGSGFSAATLPPAATGRPTDRGFDARAIARWDVVPNQDVSQPFAVGIVAFHMNGIKHVAISVEGGPWVKIHHMTKNPRTAVYEYWAWLDPSDFPPNTNGLVELRAIAVPEAGQPRVLADTSPTRNDAGDGSLWLAINDGKLARATVWVDPSADGTAADGSAAHPFTTLQAAVDWLAGHRIAGGATVFLRSGEYLTPSGDAVDNARWLTITAAPGVDPTTVKIVGMSPDGHWNTQHIRFFNLAVVPRPDFAGCFAAPSMQNRSIWFDGVTLDGGDREIATAPTVNGASTYWTDVTIHEYANPVDTWNGLVLLARQVHLHGVLNDSFRMHTLLVDSSTDDVDPRDSGRHPEILQPGSNAAAPDNVIVYGLAATNVRSQGISIRGSDWALVNVLIQQVGAVNYWQVNEALVDHVLLWHITTVDQAFLWRTGNMTSRAENISIRNSSFTSMSIGASSTGNPTDPQQLLAATQADNNNFADGSCYGCRTVGAHATTGDPDYSDPADDDFRPAQRSPLRDRVKTPLVPADLDGRRLATDGSAAIGALQPAR